MFRSGMRGSVVCLVAALLLVGVPAQAPAGEGDYEPDDTHEHGAPYFGEAMDIGAHKPLEGVLVKGQVKGSLRQFAIRTGPEGRFRRAGLGPDIDPANVVLTCDKSGYRTVEVMRRRMSGAQYAPVEVECLLERQ